MGFGGGSSGGITTISAANDVSLNNAATDEVLTYNSTIGRWQNKSVTTTVGDATTSTNGVIRLAGDLAGTAASPTVPSLSLKEPSIAPGSVNQYYRGDKSWQTLDKSSVGLANIDNTSDLAKPISTAVQAALNAKADTAAIGAKVLLIDTAASLPAGTPSGVIVVVKS